MDDGKVPFRPWNESPKSEHRQHLFYFCTEFVMSHCKSLPPLEESLYSVLLARLEGIERTLKDVEANTRSSEENRHVFRDLTDKVRDVTYDAYHLVVYVDMFSKQTKKPKKQTNKRKVSSRMYCHYIYAPKAPNGLCCLFIVVRRCQAVQLLA